MLFAQRVEGVLAELAACKQVGEELAVVAPFEALTRKTLSENIEFTGEARVGSFPPRREARAPCR
jgi:hypothetical protein